MRRLTLFISVALALLAFAIPATAGAKRHHKRTHHARVADRNHNGMPDRWERKNRVHSATADPDGDNVTNLGEFHNGTNPRDADTDNDGVEDGDDDANEDGVDDADEQSGTIQSFDGTTLTVKLVNGKILEGTVNGDTEIKCETPAPVTTTTATTRDGGESSDSTESGDDNSGPGSTTSGPSTETEQGDDNQGDDNDDQGEDDQGDEESNCGTGALTENTIVKEAELHLTSTGAVFEEIKLSGKAPA